MSKPTPARSCTTNWADDNAALRKRGSLLIWLDKGIASHAPHEGRPGPPPVFSDAAIQFCQSNKVLFKLPLRQTAGMVVILLQLAGRAFWKRLTGYHARSRAEARMRCLKSFGERIAAVRHCRWDQWRANRSPPTAKRQKSTFAQPS